jgi:hypothetical protein
MGGGSGVWTGHFVSSSLVAAWRPILGDVSKRAPQRLYVSSVDGESCRPLSKELWANYKEALSPEHEVWQREVVSRSRRLEDVRVEGYA